MKVLYDHQAFCMQDTGGISRYYHELMQHFHNHPLIRFELATKYSNNIYLWEAIYAQFHRKWLPGITFRGKKHILDILNRPLSKNHIARGDFDLFHPTYYNPYFLDALRNKPFVLTIHDMIHELFPSEFKPDKKVILNKMLLAQKASLIITVSEQSKKDIIHFYNIPAERIQVIYHGCSFKLPPTDYTPAFHHPEHYILYVGQRYGYKNFNRFIAAISPLLKTDRRLYCLCIGGKPFTSIELNMFKKLGIEQKILHYRTDDVMLAYLYQHACALVNPSLYEGFGLPLLEAFSCGCPVAASQASCFPEIAGEAALYFNPYSEDSIREVVARVVYDDDLKEKLIYKGYKRLAMFSWSKTAEETLKAYNRCLELHETIKR